MSLGWEPDDIVAIVNGLDERYGEEALQIVEDALGFSAYQWGQELRENDCPDLSPENFINNFKDSVDEEMEFIVDNDGTATIITKKCRVAEVFKELDSTEIGFRFKCAQDFKIAEGYDSEMKLEIPKCLMRGDSCCQHIYTKE